MNEKEYSVSETVRLVGVEAHVLRYWEEGLQIEIRRTSQGHRVYSQENVETFRRVKELKGKGLQLKAIRLLLEQQEPEGEDAKLLGQIRKIAGEDGKETFAGEKEPVVDEAENTEETHGEEKPGYEIISFEEKRDPKEQFREILRSLIAEVVSEQNEKLERAIAANLKMEMEDLYLQYYQMMQEAAASREGEAKRKSRIRNLLARFLGND